MEYRNTVKDEYYYIIEPLVTAAGLVPVEISSVKKGGVLYLYLVIYSGEGVSVNECSKIHRMVQGRLEALTDSRDLHIEVSSPGTSRNFKYADDFMIFKGKKVKILLNNENEWIRGVIYDAGESEAVLSISGHLKSYRYSDIRKAKLDF